MQANVLHYQHLTQAHPAKFYEVTHLPEQDRVDDRYLFATSLLTINQLLCR
jgi:hypothetical protein